MKHLIYLIALANYLVVCQVRRLQAPPPPPPSQPGPQQTTQTTTNTTSTTNPPPPTNTTTNTQTATNTSTTTNTSTPNNTSTTTTNNQTPTNTTTTPTNTSTTTTDPQSPTNTQTPPNTTTTTNTQTTTNTSTPTNTSTTQTTNTATTTPPEQSTTTTNNATTNTTDPPTQQSNVQNSPTNNSPTSNVTSQTTPPPPTSTQTTLSDTTQSNPPQQQTTNQSTSQNGTTSQLTQSNTTQQQSNTTQQQQVSNNQTQQPTNQTQSTQQNANGTTTSPPSANNTTQQPPPSGQMTPNDTSVQQPAPGGNQTNQNSTQLNNQTMGQTSPPPPNNQNTSMNPPPQNGTNQTGPNLQPLPGGTNNTQPPGGQPPPTNGSQPMGGVNGSFGGQQPPPPPNGQQPPPLDGSQPPQDEFPPPQDGPQGPPPPQDNACGSGKYMSSNLTCQVCHYSCENCFGPNPDNCLRCNGTTRRVPNFRNCDCLPPYFDVGVSQCGMHCDRTCLTCKTSAASSCQSCNPLQHRVLQKGYCVCDSGYYLDSVSANCQACDSSCKTCSGGSVFQCTTCSDSKGTFRVLENNKCQCQEGYYSMPGVQACLDKCSSNYYADKIQRMCVKCHPICDSCTGSTAQDCKKCVASSTTIASINTVLQTQYKITNSVNLQGQVLEYTCDSSQQVTIIQPSSDEYQYSWNMVTKVDKNETLSTNGSYEGINIFNIPALTAQQGTTYEVTFSVVNKKGEKFESTVNLVYQTMSNQIIIIGGDRQIGQSQKFTMEVQLFNPDVSQYPIAVTNQSTYSWNCTDLATDKDCVDRLGVTINVTNLTLDYNAKIFQPYSVNEFKFEVYDSTSFTTLTDQAVIIIIEEAIPTISMNIDQNLLTSPISPSQDIDVDLQISEGQDPDLLSYSANFIYDYEIVSSSVYQYKQFTLRIKEFCSGFNTVAGDQLSFQSYVFNPQFALPAKSTVTFQVNIPPQNCTFISSPQDGGIDFKTSFKIQVINCSDYDLPLTYRFIYYQNQADIDQDNSVGLLFNGYAINDYQTTSLYNGPLPANINGESHIFIMVQVQDSQGGVSNYTTSIKIDQDTNLQGSSIQQNLENILDTTTRISYLQIITPRLSNIKDQSDITQLKQYMLGYLKNLNIKKLDNLQINQISQINQQLLSGQDILDQLDISSIAYYLDLLMLQAKNAIQIQKQIKNQIKKFGGSVLLQLESDENQLQIQRIGAILQQLVERAQSIILSLDPQDNSTNTTLNRIDDTISGALVVINLMSDLQFIDIIPNQSPLQYQGKTITTSNHFFTLGGLARQIGFNPKQNSVYRMTQEEEINRTSNSTSTDFYTFKARQFKQNPLSASKQFPYKDQISQLVQLSIKSQSNGTYDSEFDLSQSEIKLQKYPYILFEVPKNDFTLYNPVCIMEYKNGSWSSKDCETTITDKYISCQCNDFGSYSVVNDHSQKYYRKTQKLRNFIKNLGAYSWTSYPLTYMMLFFVFISLLNMIIGYFGDHVEKSKIHSERRLLKQQVKETIIPPKTQNHIETITQQQQQRTERKRPTFSKVPSIDVVQNDVGQSFSEISKIDFEDKSKVAIDSENADVPKKDDDPKFPRYLALHHRFTNPILKYDKVLSRPTRAFLYLIYFSITLYLTIGINFYLSSLSNPIQILLINILTVMLSLGHRLIIKGSGRKSKFFVIVTTVVGMIYLIWNTLYIMTLTDDSYLNFLWTRNLLVVVIIDHIVLQPLEIGVKFHLAKGGSQQGTIKQLFIDL